MGLIVGEGSFSGEKDKGRPVITMNLHVDDPLPLECLVRYLGGTVYGPYEHGGRRYRKWVTRFEDLPKAIAILKEFLPSSKKREQFKAWLKDYDLENADRFAVSCSVGTLHPAIMLGA